MLSIPSYPILLPFLAIFGFFGAIASIYFFLTRDENESDWETFQSLLGIFIGSLFFIIGTVLSIGATWSTYNIRNIQISTVKAFRIIKSDDEHKNDNTNFVIFEKPQAVHKALESLSNCYGSLRNHESYQDGYKLQLIFSDETLNNEIYISVYRKSNNIERKSVVIPHYYENKNLDLGEYNCSEFQNWVRENIDPLFNDTK